MLFLVILVTIVSVLLGSYLLFFATGGCFSLFRTALNDKLPADIKFRWMLAQVYFPPATLAYLALVEKNRKYQAIGMACVLIAGLYPSYKLMSYRWDKLAVSAPKVAQEILTEIHNTADLKRKHEHQKENHKQEDVLNKKHKELAARLDIIKKATTDPKQLQAISTINMMMIMLPLNYDTGTMPEEDYAKILAQLDTITANGTLAYKDSQEWLILVSRILKKNKEDGRVTPANANPVLKVPLPVHSAAQGQAATQPASFADPVRLSDPLSKQAADLSERMLTMYNGSVDPVARKALDDTDATLANLRGAYVYKNLPADIYGGLLNNLTTKISGGKLSQADADQWIASARQAMVTP